ncbi:MAG: hypothetical protein R3D80_05265 [Paracoccaceae bacterium]
MPTGRISVWRGAVCAALCITAPAGAGPIATIESGAGVALPAGTAVLDIRDEESCLASSPPGARCLPAEQMLTGADGAPIGFHALRWALGTLGLTGAETLVIYQGDTVAPEDARAAAALVYLAGQAEVLVHAGPALETDVGGDGRAPWREVVYTAPMRTGEMTIAAAPAGSLRDRLSDFATGGGSVAFAAPGS